VKCVITNTTPVPLLAEQKIDAFNLDYSPISHLIVNGATRIANTHMTMKPWVPNLDVNCEMFASLSTFADGSTAFKLNTSDFSANNVNGDPSVRLIVDPTTGETQAVLRVDFGIPRGESSYCFQATIDQHSKFGTPVHRVKVNNKYCGFTVTPIWIGENCGLSHRLKIDEDPNNNAVHKANWPAHRHTIKARERDAGKFAIGLGTDYNCIEGTGGIGTVIPAYPDTWTPWVSLNVGASPAPKAGDEYKVVICGTNLTAADDNSFLAIKVLKLELEKCDKKWVPKGGAEANDDLKIKAFTTPRIAGKIQFDLTDVSDEDGYCLNAPYSLPLRGGGSVVFVNR